jgi:hypothetical protein
MGEVVAGVHDEVRLELVQASNPIPFAELSGHLVQVGYLQDLQRPATRTQNGYFDSAEPVRADLIPGRVGETAGCKQADTERDPR